jgi:hypothetical protein
MSVGRHDDASVLPVRCQIALSFGGEWRKIKADRTVSEPVPIRKKAAP